MKFVIGTIALLVLGSIFGSVLSVLFWPDVGASPTATATVRGADTQPQPDWYR
jgi:hypothetical protein